MNEKQLAQVQTLTRFTAENFPGATFRNATAVGSLTVVIDVYTENGSRYFGAYTVLKNGEFFWYGQSWYQASAGVGYYAVS